MAAKIVVPQMGESVVEATVGEWLVQVGDAISVGDVLVSLETDKVDVEVGATSAGVLAEIARQAGEDVAVGDVLGVIDEDGAGGAARAAESGDERAAESEAVAETAAAPPAAEEKATPVARRVAAGQGVDLSQV
ncbi:MAG: hypothetical protein KC425_20390, partial [Anaerolineales bacterium]|nr:hypothetical protein [Anaerolineales bacterium]